MRLTFSRLILVSVVVGSSVLASAAPALAASGSGYAAWSVSGTSNAYTGTVTLPTGFPVTTFTSDSRAAVAIATSATQPATSSFGQVFGSSVGQQYIGLRPSGSAAGTVSTTTYTFDTPTPAGTWGIALGDIDAESITVSATNTAGEPVSSADLGFRSVANALGTADTLTVTDTGVGYTVADQQCPTVPDRCNTSGATAWFQPQIPVTSLTVTSTFVSGAPVYQTWFATIVRSIGGTVDIPAAVILPAPVNVDLFDDRGSVVASTTAEADGSYLFDGLAARGDYIVAVSPNSLPAGAISGDPVTADTLTGDVVDANLSITGSTAQPAMPITGTITDDKGVPVQGAQVTVTGQSDAGDEVNNSATTDTGGMFNLDNVPDGQYVLQLTPPAGSGLIQATQLIQISADNRVLALVLNSIVSSSIPGLPSPQPAELAATGNDTVSETTFGLFLIGAGLTAAITWRRRNAKRS